MTGEVGKCDRVKKLISTLFCRDFERFSQLLFKDLLVTKWNGRI